MDERARPATTPEPHRHPVVRGLLLVGGWAALILGFIGLLLPLMPTTPFMILAAFLFAGGSPRMHEWLITHPRFGGPIRRFHEDRSVTLRHKVLAIVLLWVSIVTSAHLFAPFLWVKIGMYAVAAGVSLYLLSLRTARPDDLDKRSGGGGGRRSAKERRRRASL